jgi:two-component system, NarL family, nitrate/nitrite response regulator NarL
MRIAIVHALPIAREGIKCILAASNEFRVVGECSRGRSALILAGLLAPDVFLIDPGGLRFDSRFLIRILLRCLPGTAVIAFAASSGPPVMDAFQAGARGVLLRSDDAQELFEALRAVGSGGWYVSRRACAEGDGRRQGTDPPVVLATGRTSDPRLN